MQWRVPEYKKDRMNTGHGDVHEIDVDDIPDFHGNIKDSSSSNTF